MYIHTHVHATSRSLDVWTCLMDTGFSALPSEVVVLCSISACSVVLVLQVRTNFREVGKSMTLWPLGTLQITRFHSRPEATSSRWG